MARPTNEERERRRVAELLKEGKDQNGKEIEEAKIISETKNSAPVTPLNNQQQQNNNNPYQQQSRTGYSVADLESEINNAGAEKNTPPPSSEQQNNSNRDLGSDNFGKEDQESDDYINPTPYNPFAEPLIENDSDANKASSNNNPGAANGVNGNTENISSDFQEPIINGAATSSTVTDNIDGKTGDPKAMNPGFDDLSPTEKRKQVELFADTILTTYAQILPLLPVSIASYNMGKMEILDRDGVIRLSMVVGRDASGELTIKEHFSTHNAEVAQTFVVTDEMKDELREPLIAVLMEKGIAPTPLTSLLIGIGRHCLMFGIAAYKFLAQKADAIEQFKIFRKEELESDREKHKQDQNLGKSQPVNNNVNSNQPSPGYSAPAHSTAGGLDIDSVLAQDNTPLTTEDKKQPKHPSQPGIEIEDVID